MKSEVKGQTGTFKVMKAVELVRDQNVRVRRGQRSSWCVNRG